MFYIILAYYLGPTKSRQGHFIKNIMNIDVLNRKIINGKSGAKYQILNMCQVIFAVS